jgi:very-short-patch-repair endonuclease
MYRVDPEMTRRARALRSAATKAERALWRLLSRYRPAFTRQLVVGPFIIDLACREAKLAVEVDGGQHSDSEADAARTRWLEGEGWTVIRFWNSEVADNPEGVAEAVLLEAAKCLGGTHPQPLPSREGRIRRPTGRGRSASSATGSDASAS